MKYFICIILFCTVFHKAKSTAQDPDIIIWNGKEFMLFANPLELHPEVDSLRKILFDKQENDYNTACYRQYIAHWQIINKILYLTHIYTCNFPGDSTEADLKKLFPQYFDKGKVKASWVTGSLLIPSGQELMYVHSGYESFYEKETLLKFTSGGLQDIIVYDNSKSRKAIYTQSSDSLSKYIYSNINWHLLPADFNGKRVWLTVQSGEYAKPDSVKIGKSSGDSILDLEAVRVISAVPEWDIIYSRGKVVRLKWRIPVVFSEENRRKYSKR